MVAIKHSTPVQWEGHLSRAARIEVDRRATGAWHCCGSCEGAGKVNRASLAEGNPHALRRCCQAGQRIFGAPRSGRQGRIGALLVPTQQQQGAYFDRPRRRNECAVCQQVPGATLSRRFRVGTRGRSPPLGLELSRARQTEARKVTRASSWFWWTQFLLPDWIRSRIREATKGRNVTSLPIKRRKSRRAFTRISELMPVCIGSCGSSFTLRDVARSRGKVRPRVHAPRDTDLVESKYGLTPRPRGQTSCAASSNAKDWSCGLWAPRKLSIAWVPGDMSALHRSSTCPVERRLSSKLSNQATQRAVHCCPRHRGGKQFADTAAGWF